MKKKIFLLTTFILVLIIGLYSNEPKEVQAADNCKTYTNYYLFLSTTTRNYYLSKFNDGEDPYTFNDEKEFNLGIPESSDDESVEILDDGVITLKSSSSSSMTIEDWFNKYKKIEDYNVPYTEDKGVTKYIRAIPFVDNEGNASEENIPLDGIDFDTFEEHVPSTIQKPEVSFAYDESSAEATITRTIASSDMENITDGNVYLPAAYFVEYEVCSIDAAEYKTVANFIDKDTNKEIKQSTNVETGLEDGDSYKAYECPVEFDFGDGEVYVLDTTEKSSFEAGEIDGEDVEFDCYYTKEETKKLTLTINFGTNSNCTNGTDILEAKTFEYEAGTKVTYKLPEIDKYEFTDVGSISPVFSPLPTVNSNNQLTFTMPSKNTSICLVYIKNSQTGAGWIYFAWIVAIAALAYSAWYFVKYYKSRNNEI